MADILRIIGYALIFSWGLLLIRSWYSWTGGSPIQEYVIGTSILAIVIGIVLVLRPRRTRQSLVRLGLLK